ncbi:MAG: DMT family transporter [Candidatus Aenigmarchaeota archaeon]|nr:DMT family transporter [Candidatus Aenigmarchaeota archaeon]
MERGYWYVILSGILAGTVVSGGRFFGELGMSFYQLSIFWFGLSALILFPFLLVKKELRLDRKSFIFYIACGLIGTVIMFGQFLPLFMGVSVAVVVLLLYTQPLWTAIFGRVLFKERFTKYKIAAIILVLIGIALLANPFQSAGIGNLSGIAIALAGGLGLSGWVITGKVSENRKYNSIKTVFYFNLFTTVFLAATYLLAVQFPAAGSATGLMFNFPPAVWLLFVLYSIANVGTFLFLYKGIATITASTAGIILLLEPVVATLIAAAFLNQPLTINILAGGGIILLANYISIKSK